MNKARDRIIFWFLIAFASFAAYAHAQEGQTKSCDGSTYEMEACLKAKTAEWDRRLNNAYQKALKDADTPAQADQLRDAQRLWARYRNANCRYYDLGEGTIARIDAGECMRSMTEARAKELEDIGRR